jgi:hypothetical protein
MDDELAKLKAKVERNLILTEKLVKDVHKIRMHFVWSSIGNVLKAIIFLTPLVIGIMFAWPYLGQIQGAYEQFRGLTETVTGVKEDIDDLRETTNEIRDAGEELRTGGLDLNALLGR